MVGNDIMEYKTVIYAVGCLQGARGIELREIAYWINSISRFGRGWATKEQLKRIYRALKYYRDTGFIKVMNKKRGRGETYLYKLTGSGEKYYQYICHLVRNDLYDY